MKKIVGIMAAAAVAASLFAVDIAAKMHGWTDLFNYEFKDGAKPSFLGVRDPFDRQFAWSSTGIGISVAGDQAGASFELNHRDVEVMSAKFWVKPFDALKISVGKLGLATNTETIDYTKLRAYEEDAAGALEGFAIDLTPIDGLTINTQVVTGQARGWGWAFWGKDGKIGQTTAKITYAADFGSIFAMFNYIDPETEKASTEISAGYTGNFDGLSIFADFAYALKANNMGADVFVNGSADALGYKVYAKYNRNLDAGTHDLLAKALVTYGLDSGTVYFKAVLPNALADGDFGVQVYPGYQFSIGSASIDAGVQLNINTDADAKYAAGTKFISVPVIYSIGF